MTRRPAAPEAVPGPGRAHLDGTRDDTAVAAVRGRNTFGDMIRTVVIFAVLIIGIVALLPKGHHAKNPATAVDYAGELQIVGNRAPFHVLAPMGLDQNWTPTHVTIAVPQNGSTVTTFDLGFYVAKPDAYVRLGQSDAPDWAASQLGSGARQSGTTTVATASGEVSYQTWVDSDGQPALVGQAGSSVVVIDGRAPAELLRTFAAALR